MDDRRLDLAEALLAKARSTSFEGERESFVTGAHQQLGAFLESGRPASARTAKATPAIAPPLQAAQASAIPSAAPADPVVAAEDSEDTEDTDTEAVLVVDLAAAERAYRRQSSWAPPSGVLVDLTI